MDGGPIALCIESPIRSHLVALGFAAWTSSSPCARRGDAPAPTTPSNDNKLAGGACNIRYLTGAAPQGQSCSEIARDSTAFCLRPQKRRYELSGERTDPPFMSIFNNAII